MSSNWQYGIKHVQPGEPVAAGVVGRPDRALEGRTDYLKDRLDAAELGQAIFDADATVSEDVLPGQPVYWNYVTKQYEKALAAVGVDAATQTLQVQATSDCVGLCYRKTGKNLADIVLRGIVNLPELTNAVGPAIAPGRYYLSATEPGKLVQRNPAVSVYVCYVEGPKNNCSDVPRVVVMPQVKEFMEAHTHYRVELVCRPAGINTVINADGGQQIHTISSPDPSLPGWLPADHASFNNKAPSGAVFGYNLAQDETLAHTWPPLPPQSVAVLWDKGAGHVGATEVPLGPTGLVICDANGIWWLSNCYGDVPWPTNYSEPGNPPQSGTPECPREESMRVSVVYLRMLLGNERRAVTSLAPAQDSPIAVLNCAGIPAPTGDLQLDLNLQTEPTEIFGGQAFKQILNGKSFQAGWLTEGVVAHNQTQLSINSSRVRNLTNIEKDLLSLPLADNVIAHQGLINISFDNQFSDRELSPQIIRLSDTVERLYLDIPYLGFPAGQASSLRLRFNVPDLNMAGNLQMRLRVRYFGRGNAGQSIPSLYMTYRRLGTPAITGTGLATTDTTVNFNSAIALPINTAVERDSDNFAVAAGDIVLVTLGRAAGDAYPEVGVLRVSGIISKVPE
ncbi:hypothetical protein EBZ39_02765 [bacterium]|nr:hypothetical protein [bacterium]